MAITRTYRPDDQEHLVAQWMTIRDCVAGEDAIKARGETYLPRPTGMDPKSGAYPAVAEQYWHNYKQRASFYGMVHRTLEMLAGMAMRKDPVAQAPEAVQAVMMDKRLRGMTISEAAEACIKELSSVGRIGILVDSSSSPSNNNQPYLTAYLAETIVEYVVSEIETPDGPDTGLSRVRLQEAVDEEDENEVERYRDLYLDDQGFYAIDIISVRKSLKDQTPANIQLKGKQEIEEVVLDTILPTFSGLRINFIPFVLGSLNGTDPTDVVRPPMIDLCKMNIAHYRNSADYEWSLFLTASPTAYITGIDDSDDSINTIGASVLWKISNSDAKVGMLEFSGQGVEALRQNMIDKESRMAVLGAYMVDTTINRNETSETARLRYRSETAVLMSACKSTDKILMRAYDMVRRMLRLDGEVTVEINKDFVETRMSGSDLVNMVSAWQRGAFGNPEDDVSRQVMLFNYRQQELIPDTITDADIIASKPPMNTIMGRVTDVTPSMSGGADNGENDGEG